MNSPHYEAIAKYYLQGFGMPKSYYTDEQLERFVTSGLITKKEKDGLITLKKEG